MDSLLVVPGLRFPFFPPRPTHGVVLTEKTCPGYVETHAPRFALQKKLNGDRVIAYKTREGRVLFLNRHGKLYTYAVLNADKLAAKLPANTLLDGEVWKKTFYPFEAVVYGDASYLTWCPSLRIAMAREVCWRDLGVPFLFDVDQAYVDGLRGNLPDWEGVVRKRLGSPYQPLGSDTQQTPGWFKNKWPGPVVRGVGLQNRAPKTTVGV